MFKLLYKYLTMTLHNTTPVFLNGASVLFYFTVELGHFIKRLITTVI